MIELHVASGESSQRLNKYLMKYLNQAPSSFIYKMLRKKNITLNGKKAQGDEILSEGDSIKLFLSDDTIDKFRNVNSVSSSKSDVNKGKHTDSSGNFYRNKSLNNNVADLIVLYKNENIMAVHKPAGVLSQKATDKDVSINEMIVDYCNANGLIDTGANIGFKPSVCNRLDRNTSGIILAGITLHGSQYLSRILKNHTCDKYYYTIVKGVFSGKKHCRAYITKDTKENISEIISVEAFDSLDGDSKKNYNYIETVFESVSGNKNYTLLKIKLITGKSHQIRAHLKHLGYPVVGDGKYGDIGVNRYFRDKYKLKHHLLHAGSISFDDVTINDKLPDVFVNICKKENIDIKDIQ